MIQIYLILASSAAFYLQSAPSEFHSFPFKSSLKVEKSHLQQQDTLQMASTSIVQPTSIKTHSYAYALMVDISVGTPAQTPFHILVDTGKQVVLWLPRAFALGWAQSDHCICDMMIY